MLNIGTIFAKDQRRK